MDSIRSEFLWSSMVAILISFIVLFSVTVPVPPGRVVGLFPADEICIREGWIRVYTFLQKRCGKFADSAGTIDL